MNRYMLIRRLRWPAILLLIGFTALLREMNLIDSWAKLFWPLLLIICGAFLLAERAALASEDYYPPYPGNPYQPGEYPAGDPFTGAPTAAASGTTGPAAQSLAQDSTAIVPASRETGLKLDGE